MAYLELPRIHFAGRFQADISTVNNVDPYYDIDQFEPRFQWLMNLPDENGLFNPFGTGAFRLRGCRVTSVVHPDGRLSATVGDDPIVGAHLAEDNLGVTAKMVDLHPNAQIVPELYGLRIRLVDGEGREFLKADFEPAAVSDLRLRYLSEEPPPDLGGMYQSVLSGLQWSSTMTSPLLTKLREATQDGRLSIKFNTGGVTDDPANPAALFGRIVGSIGVYRTGEPRQFLAARRLRSVPDGSLSDAPCLLDEASGRLFIDLGNSVPVAAFDGPPVDVGPLRLAALTGEAQPRVLAPLERLDGGFYADRAAIATVSLTPEQVATARESVLALVDASDPPQQVLAESANATYLRADNYVTRLFPGTAQKRVTTTFYATRFGRPAPGLQVLFDNGRPRPSVTYPSTPATTDAAGRAEVWMSSDGPEAPTPYIDGEAFDVPYGFAGQPPEGTVWVRVFKPFQAPANPTWARDIQPIFQQYANLYPAMRRVFDMGNYNHVVKYRNVITAAMSLSPSSPNHMPVTRDLSPGKRDMIMKWLAADRPAVLDIDSPETLRTVLQQALLLEQAVMPPYLAALFSLKPDRNVEIADIINGVVREEMLHLALVGNLLNAVGGRPQIGRPGLVPTYPGRLPAPVLPDLIVRLRRCSVEHIRDVFLTIEKPQHPSVDGRPFHGAVIDRKRLSVDARGKLQRAEQSELNRLADWFNKAEYEPMTIGWFYNQIARAIWRLDKQLTARGKKLFTGDPARQVSWPKAPGTLYQITDVRTALLAIYEIIEQGEGTPQNLDADPDPERLGHYYRFQQIVAGRRLIKNSAGKWVYEGDPVRFDPDGVYPMADDPDAFRLPVESVGRRESELFNEMYTNLLTTLNQVFNGRPDGLADAVGLMYSLQVQAKKLLGMPTAPGAPTTIGPPFQSPGVVLG